MRRIIIPVLAGMVMFFGTMNKVQAQPDLDVLLRTGVEDANLFMEAYLDPLANAVSASLVNGWYNTARAHQSLGFDLTITANAVYIPDEALTFNVNQLGLTNTRLISPSDGVVPTVLGPDDLASTYEYGEGTTTEGTFNGPDGFALKETFGMQAVPVPMIQLGLGVVANTDIKFRVTPRITYDEAEFQMLGGAVMHDISQYFLGDDGPVNLAVLAGYTHVSLEYDMVNAGVPEVETDDGTSEMDIRGWTIQGLASKDFGVLTVYGGLGYNFTSADMAMLGEYRVTNEGSGSTETLVDPIDLSFAQNSPRATLGLRVKLSVITLHGDYTLQKYNTLSAGIGVSVR